MKQFDTASSTGISIKASNEPRLCVQKKRSFFAIKLVVILLMGLTYQRANAQWLKSANWSVADGSITVTCMISNTAYNLAHLTSGQLSIVRSGAKTAYYNIKIDISGTSPVDNSTSISPYITSRGNIFSYSNTDRNSPGYDAASPGTGYFRTYTINLTKDIEGVQSINLKANQHNDYSGSNYAIDDNLNVGDLSTTSISMQQEFMTVGNSAYSHFSFTKPTLKTADYSGDIKLMYNSPAEIHFNNSITPSTSGSLDIPLSVGEFTYEFPWYFRQTNGYIINESSKIPVPAFTIPKSAAVEYDSNAHEITFSWTIDPIAKPSTDNYIKSQFLVQIADNPNFTNPTLVKVDYNPSKTDYNIVRDKNIASHMYFRVARDYTATNWSTWAVSKGADVIIPFNPINSGTVTLQPDHSALITWGVRPYGWITGSSFVITRTNNTTKTKTDIQLTRDDFYKGSYTDDLIAICNEYEYKIQVVPPAGLVSTPYSIATKILPTEIGTISNLVVSKGYFPDRTELKWSSQGTFDNFIIKRAVYGTNTFIQIGNVAGGSTSDYQTEDSKGTPGVYYTYMVLGSVKCNNNVVYSKDTLYTVGFRSPTGNINGRITYENGQAVENAAVRLQANDAAQLGQSILLNGSTGSYLKLDSLHVPFTDSAFTIEAWIKPADLAPKSQVIFSREPQYELGFDAAGLLYFSYNGKSVTGKYINPNQSFIHVAGIHSRDSLKIVVNDSVISAVANAFKATTNLQKAAYIGHNTNGNNFKGYIDEMRAWNIALDKEIIKRDYTRLLPGEETGLAAYWRFDETIKNQFYDLAHNNDQYNQNDGILVDEAAAVHSSVIPTADQLSLKGYTNSLGDYSITGIPYKGNGTAYTVVPLLGTHQFDPISANRLISSSSNQFTVDFKDKSSFPVSGFVYYNNSTVPVEGVQFKIDGKFAQEGNGNIIQTDASGKFTVSVPVGTHEVQALKNSHIFLNSGKITDPFGNNLNYQDAKASIVLLDSTTVRFVGRVAGGAIEEAYPLGHSLSTNNLGKELSVTMGLTSGNKYELNSTSKTVVYNHLLPSSQKDSSKVHKTRVDYLRNQIVIHPDSLTGEFVVNLIPEKFLVNNVGVTGWGDILGGKPVSIDLSNKFPLQRSGYSYTDSVLDNSGVWQYARYSDTMVYNASYKFINRVSPTVTINQQDNNGKDLPYFGNNLYSSITLAGKKDTVNVIDPSASGKGMYVFGNPVFIQNQVYDFNIKAFEAYPFYESVRQDGTPVIKQVNGKDLIYNVPTQDGFVSLYNRIRNGSADPDTVSLNNKGVATYQFTAGDPDLAAKGLKDFAATIDFGQGANVNWSWLGDPKLRVYVIGGKLTGTDFVTAGPNKILMVLRDPAGSKSFSYAEKGSTITTTETSSGSVDNEGDLSLTQKLGAELVTFTGVGVGTIQSAVTSTGTEIGVHHEEHLVKTNTKETSTTLTTRFQTSDDPLFVGPPADVFVGYSTNITYGQSNNITIIKRADKKASDSTIFESGPASPYLVIQRNGINIGETFGTLFAYPQQHIKNVLIPNLVKIRNDALLPPTVLPADAQNLANTKKRPVYVSKLDVGDNNFGKSNTDTVTFPTAKTDPFGDGKSYSIYFPVSSLYRTDTIMILNQYVKNWEKRMEDNERAKLEATLLQNYSFHAGAPIEHSTQTAIVESKEEEHNFVISGSITGSTDVKIFGSGFEFKIQESIGTNQVTTSGSSTENSSTLGFLLGSNGTDDYFSVDVANAEDNSFVFRTKGGVSACPYEGANVTEFYQPGTVLDQPTQRIEVPKISVEKPSVSGVPSSRPASFKLLLRNESETKADATFVLGYVDNDSIKGATISVDGTPIGGTGRSIVVKFGETLTKEITLTKGPSAMDYNNIMILLHSACQYDPTGYQQNIADTVLISAHFIPSCSDINIKTPKDKWILNSETPVDANGKRYIPITVDKFDINNSLFDHIELQYKPSSTSTWITSMKFYSDSAKFLAAQGDKKFITNASAILYNLVLDDASFNDQNYDIQAVSYCKVGSADYVTTESNVVSGIKDTYFPRLFGSPQPANGVLGISDEVRLNFNETIAAGLLTYTDFQVTGIRNGVKGDHSVSVNLDGQTNYVATEFDKNLAAKNVTAEMWILPAKQANQTIFSHGSVNESMELALTSDNHLQVTVGKKVIRSDKAVDYKAGEWAHVALVYNAAGKTVTAIYNFVEYISNAPVDIYAGIGHFEYGRSISKQGDYFTGKMHEARVWSDTLTAVQIQVNSLTQFSGAENKMLAYYPMNEGKGTAVLDKAHGSNAELIGQWTTPAGKAVTLKGNSYVKMNTATSPVTSEMDYTLELWFKADANQSNATIASNGKGDGTDGGGSLNLFSVGFENGKLTYWNNGVKVQADENYLDNKWHHFAFAVNRNSGNAQMFVDGIVRKYVDAKNISGIASPSTYLGVRAYHDAGSITVTKYEKYFTGNVDEFRIWKTYLNQTIISNNNNVHLKGDEIGLLSYYPFEKYFVFQNNAQLGYTLSDMKIQEDPNTKVPDANGVNSAESDETAPIKARGPVDNLQFDFVVNNDALIINLLEPKQAIDKTIVRFTVKNARDLNGNPILSPITWTAYIDKNQLKWSDNELNITKDVYAPMQFESYLVNSGGNVQRYRLDNLPTWLTASPATGTIDPKGKQKVTFTVNEGLNVGQYDEILYMRNDNNESEALAVNLKVKGKQPDWKVNPADFKYNMSVYGKIRVNNIFSTNKEDLLAAFMNGKCVGVTNNTYNAQNDLWYAYLTVYSDTVQFNNLEFRIYQAGTGKTYQAVPTPSRQISFKNNDIIGTAQSPVIFDGKEIVFQDITLNQNWNWISFNVVNTGADSIQSALKNGKWQSGDIIKNEEKGFDQYSSIVGWKGQLDTVKNVTSLFNTSLFMLSTANAQTLSITGTVANVKSIPIRLKGNRWSYISYLPQVNMTVKDALAGYVASNEDVIKSQSGFAMYDSRNGWVGNLTYLEPGKGYMFYRKANTDTSFTYPTLNGSLTNHPARQANLLLNELQTPVLGNYLFAHNMTVTAVIESDFAMQPGDMVFAYVNGEMRSKAIAIPNAVLKAGTFFFNIAGGQEQPVYFEIERNGEVIAESSTLFNFKANNSVGTLGKPLVIQVKKATVGVSVYPNPFFREVSINVKLAAVLAQQSHEVQVSVYDLNGRLIVSRSKEIINGGIYRATWNGKGANGVECAKGTYLINVNIDGTPHSYKVIKQ